MSDEKEININIEDGYEKKSVQSEAVDEPATDDSQAAEAKTEKPVEVVEELSEEEKLRRQLTAAEEKHLLAMADFENYKKRQARRQEEFYRTANDALLGRLLDVLDNFDRALAHAGESETQAGLLDGARLIHKQLHEILGHYQVTPIETIGQSFDPNLHEALMQVDSDEFDEGIIAMEISKGYKANGRVLRHSKVGVSKGKPEIKTETSKETSTENITKNNSEEKSE